jgi:phosphoribosylamine--glycine ligase
LAWKCAASPRVTEVIVAPGNAGTAHEPKVRNVNVAADDVAGLVALARSERVDLTIVGPEAPLVIGVVDEFEKAGLKCFGPRRAPAQLEGSKAFTKEFLRRHHIPTASYATFTRESFDRDYVRRQRTPIVVKASGLAAGKGVVIVETAEAAIATAESMFAGQFGDAGQSSLKIFYRARKPASSSWLTANTSSRLPRLRITSDCWMRIRDPTLAAWARIRLPR